MSKSRNYPVLSCFDYPLRKGKQCCWYLRNRKRGNELEQFCKLNTVLFGYFTVTYGLSLEGSFLRNALHHIVNRSHLRAILEGVLWMQLVSFSNSTFKEAYAGVGETPPIKTTFRVWRTEVRSYNLGVNNNNIICLSPAVESSSGIIFVSNIWRTILVKKWEIVLSGRLTGNSLSTTMKRKVKFTESSLLTSSRQRASDSRRSPQN